MNVNAGQDTVMHLRKTKKENGRIALGTAVPSAHFHRDFGIWRFFERKHTARRFECEEPSVVVRPCESANLMS